MAEQEPSKPPRLTAFHALVQCDKCRYVHSYLLKDPPADVTQVKLGLCRVMTGRGFACGGELYLLHRTSYAQMEAATDSREETA